MTAHEDILREARKIDAPTPDSRTPKPIPLEQTTQPATGVSGSLGTFIRENPGPSLLIGAGLAWLFVNRERERTRSLPTRLRDRAHDAKAATQESYAEARVNAHLRVEHAKEAAGERMDAARQATNERLDAAKSAMQQRSAVLQQKYNSMLDENPLALGACALAAGLAIGLLIPPTRRENELLGEASDSLMHQARDIVNEARRAAVSTLRSNSHAVQEKLVEAKEEAKDAVRESAHEAEKAFKQELNERKDEL